MCATTTLNARNVPDKSAFLLYLSASVRVHRFVVFTSVLRKVASCPSCNEEEIVLIVVCDTDVVMLVPASSDVGIVST